MSSEYSIHLGDRHITGRVASLGPELPSTTVRLAVGDMSLGTGDPSTREGFILYIKDDRLLEASLLFHKIAQDLAALLPDVDACCRCVPGTPDDQCAEHGFGAFKIKAAASCPLCGQSSPGGEAHSECAAREQFEADQGRGDDIPRDEAAEHVDPPHRWG